MSPPDPRIAVVVVTRDRRSTLLGTLEILLSLPESPEVVVVDNASTDGTAAEVERRFPRVRLERLPNNAGSAGRTVGVGAVRAPYVAFSDDDSWWAPGSLARAADILDRSPRLGLIAARILVGPEERLDPVSVAMERSPLPPVDDVGPGVLGFVACGSVVRRHAYLQAGGFHPRFGVGGEEELLAIDLASAGWDLAYAPDVVAHHHPARVERPRRKLSVVRNELWTAWLRRAPTVALRRTARAAWAARRDRMLRRSLADAVAGLPWVLAERRPIPAPVESSLRALERGLP